MYARFKVGWGCRGAEAFDAAEATRGKLLPCGACEGSVLRLSQRRLASFDLLGVTACLDSLLLLAETALGWRREPNRTAAAEARHHSDRRGELGVQNGRGHLTHFSPASHVSAAGRNATRCWGWSALTASQQRQLIAATRADGQLYEQAFYLVTS